MNNIKTLTPILGHWRNMPDIKWSNYSVTLSYLYFPIFFMLEIHLFYLYISCKHNIVRDVRVKFENAWRNLKECLLDRSQFVKKFGIWMSKTDLRKPLPGVDVGIFLTSANLDPHQAQGRVHMSWKILEKSLNFKNQNPGLENSWKNGILKNVLEKSWKITKINK